MAHNLSFTATVTHIALSGGFWGLLADDGQRYRPVDGLPMAFQKEGLQVQVKARPATGFSIFMWGKDVALIDIQAL
jgi:hypothetical protein